MSGEKRATELLRLFLKAHRIGHMDDFIICNLREIEELVERDFVPDIVNNGKAPFKSAFEEEGSLKYLIYDGRYHTDPDRALVLDISSTLKQAKESKSDHGEDCVIEENAEQEGELIPTGRMW